MSTGPRPRLLAALLAGTAAVGVRALVLRRLGRTFAGVRGPR
ncbi:hypothetical protein SK069_10440 [Patulibacter brassicae]|uniref:Uncharacterized protein n=1 Tax=Patulibacter brassicae TaxID=1705717 RepID=A0ABU4VKY8_9ACTN|nr:hypothetical protein [Patulibacter brassicae]MDX8152012.1 hypothetical protein [Patulibacter brassicae]